MSEKFIYVLIFSPRQIPEDSSPRQGMIEAALGGRVPFFDVPWSVCVCVWRTVTCVCVCWKKMEHWENHIFWDLNRENWENHIL